MAHFFLKKTKNFSNITYVLTIISSIQTYVIFQIGIRFDLRSAKRLSSYHNSLNVLCSIQSLFLGWKNIFRRW